MAILLTPAELVALTDRARGRDQVEWLRARGWAFSIGVSGRPKVDIEEYRRQQGMSPTELPGETAPRTPSRLMDLTRGPVRLTYSRDAAPPSLWAPPEIKLLTLEELRALPYVGRGSRGAGVYFLWQHRTIVYIGCSARVRARVGMHASRPLFKFNRATYMLIAWPWNMALEALYIRAYRPPANSTYVPPAGKEE